MSTKKPARLTQAEKQRIVELRIEGHSIRNIAASVGRSANAVLDVLHNSPTDIASLTKQAMESAAESFSRLVDPEWLAQIAARQTLRILSQCDQLHARIEMAMIEPDPDRYSQLSRANAAQSTTLANLAKTYSSVLPVRQVQESEELPELTVRVMTEADVQRIRAQQEKEAAILTGAAV